MVLSRAPSVRAALVEHTSLGKSAAALCAALTDSDATARKMAAGMVGRTAQSIRRMGHSGTAHLEALMGAGAEAPLRTALTDPDWGGATVDGFGAGAPRGSRPGDGGGLARSPGRSRGGRGRGVRPGAPGAHRSRRSARLIGAALSDRSSLRRLDLCKPPQQTARPLSEPADTLAQNRPAGDGRGAPVTSGGARGPLQNLALEGTAGATGSPRSDGSDAPKKACPNRPTGAPAAADPNDPNALKDAAVLAPTQSAHPKKRAEDKHFLAIGGDRRPGDDDKR